MSRAFFTGEPLLWLNNPKKMGLCPTRFTTVPSRISRKFERFYGNARLISPPGSPTHLLSTSPFRRTRKSDSSPIRGDASFSTASGETPNQPGSDGIEKRSKIEELEQPEARRPRSSLQDSRAPPEPEDDPTILEFPASILKGTGLYSIEGKLVLYRRENVNALFTFLEDVLYTRTDDNNPYKLAWILGPPGVGKSFPVFAFTRSLPVSEWSVTWIHSSSRGERFSLYHRDNTGIRTEKFKLENRHEYLNQLKVENKHLLVLDGFTNGTTNNTMRTTCEFWLKNDFEMRRLFVVCSMASRFKSSSRGDDMRLNVTDFTVSSWTLGEYKAALEKPALYATVQEKLKTDTDKSSDELVESKYYFAGGSARYMFLMYTDEVKKDLNLAIENVSDIRALAAGRTGVSSPGFVHRLISFQDGIRGIVSQYAANGLAIKLGTELVEHFTRIYRWKLSLPMKGFLFEMWFFAKLSGDGLSYDMIDGRPGGTWAKSNPVDMPSKNEKLSPESPTWFQPAWNNGGYDAVYVDPQTKTVRFVQITLNNHHSFKIEFFERFLNRLSTHMQAETLEIFFVYPKGADPTTPSTEGEGRLDPFNWKKGEEWSKVTKVTLDWPT
ncbi:unnamed protein product [Calypogeia fissa]